MADRQAMKEKLTKARSFFSDELWLADLSRGKASLWRRLCYPLLRVGVAVGRGYKEDRCGLQASALTYITLVSLVPILAIMFAFLKGMGGQAKLFDALGIERVMVRIEEGVSVEEYRFKEDLSKVSLGGYIKEIPEQMKEVMLRVFEYVDRTNFAAMGVVGSLLLLFSVVMSIAKLEVCFNQIWGVKKERSLPLKFMEYLIILIMAPLFFVVVTSANSMLQSTIVLDFLEEHTGAFYPFLISIIKLTSLLIVFMGLGALFVFMPYTKVKLSSGIIAGIITGFMWVIVQIVYLKMQFGLAKYNTIYGTFAILPFFLAWLYANWCIVLVGCEISYALQYQGLIRIDKHAKPLPTGACICLAHLAMFEASRLYAQGDSWNPMEYGVKHSIPLAIIEFAVAVLVNSKLLIKVDGKPNEERFVPGCPPSRLTLARVDQAFRDYRAKSTLRFEQMLPPVLMERLKTCYENYISDLAETSYLSLTEAKA